MASTPSSVPALKPPEGVIPNFKNPESLWKWSILCISMCLSFTTIAFFLRAYVRIGIKREWILEDWMCLISWLGLGTFCALVTTMMRNHGGVHAWDVTVPEIHRTLYWFNASTIQYGPTILCTKLAVLLLYRRIFLPVKWNLFDWVIRIFMAILIGFYVATTFTKIWECKPREKIWDKSIPGTCIDLPVLLDTSGLFNVVTDVIILLIPVKAVWNLHMNKKRKMITVSVFTVGLTAPVFSAIGFVVRVRTSANPDVSYHDPEISLWAAAEVSSGLICVCIPTLAPLIFRRRSARRPSHSILNGRTNSRRIYYAGAIRQSSSMDEKDLFDHAKLEDGHAARLTRPPAAVVTDIEGGLDAGGSADRDIEMRHMGLTESGEQVDRTNGIVATVRMEHSYI